MATTNKALERKKKEKDLLIFKLLEMVAKENGMDPVSQQALEKIYKSIDLKVPDVPRTKDIKEKVSFVVFIGRLLLYLHTGFNAHEKEFSRNGALSLVIVDPFKKRKGDKERVFYRQFKRVPGVQKKVEDHILFFLKELSHEDRPLLKNGEWASILEKSQDEFYWVDKNKKVIRGLFDSASRDSWVQKIQKQRCSYESFRKKKGIKKRRRKIKKPYKTRKGK